MYHSWWTYIESEGERIFTMVLLPKAEGKFPVVLMRLPYVDYHENTPENQVTAENLARFAPFLERGYAFVVQHCRGRGKSSGDFIPYIHEREDGLNLQSWVRQQSFYNGELYLKGMSYMTSVHYATAPFAPDIKGAVFGVQDCERYNVCYRNGMFKTGLHGSWSVEQYKARAIPRKAYTAQSYNMLPVKDFSRTVLGEEAPELDGILCAPDPAAPIWSTRLGGADSRGATEHVRFPVLLMTGFYDIYTGGIFDMWNRMDGTARSLSALVVSPNDHADEYDAKNGIHFPNGRREEAFGISFEIDWFDHIRLGTPSPFPQGEVTYYTLFENAWKHGFTAGQNKMRIGLGDGAVSYVYNPFDPPEFKGGLSRSFGGAVFQDAPNSRHDIISRYTRPFERDTQVVGKMEAVLSVASDCADTCFYIRLSIEKEQGDFGLRDDITTLCYAMGDYTPGSKVQLRFEFDEHAFLIRQGERLRVDIASADSAHYLRHTNQKGPYWEQATAKPARNTVYLGESVLILPAEP